MDVGMLRVRHDAASASTVRHAITADLSTQALTRDSVDDVVLVASELVGNAVVHVADRADLDVEWQLDNSEDATWVILRVQDGSAQRPTLRHVDALATSGRGLAIVAAVADEWGVRELGEGKQVWARVPVHHVL